MHSLVVFQLFVGCLFKNLKIKNSERSEDSK